MFHWLELLFFGILLTNFLAEQPLQQQGLHSIQLTSFYVPQYSSLK